MGKKTAGNMAERDKYQVSQFLNFAEDSYLEQTSRPVCAVMFLLPFIIFYELGTILINTDVLNQSQVRVVAFLWLQNFLEGLGFGSKLAWVAPPVAVMAILLAQQVASKKRWRFNYNVMGPMAAECVMLAVPLIVLSLFLNTSAPAGVAAGRLESVAACSVAAAGQVVGNGSLFADIVTGIGAGIYEELVFRLILICFLMLLFQDVFRLGRANSIVLSVLVSAAMFSAHHHIFFVNGRLSQAAAFNWTEFGFRTIAGVYFAVLFAVRGFGIAAGTHAFYDIMAVLVNTIFFGE